MNGELLSVFDYIEREKGIERQILIEAVESALVSAARKILGKKVDNILVRVDKETGQIKVFSGEEEIASNDFGRIAAQTAKQVIIQKLREAEREVIYNEFQNRIGEITNGVIYRFERDGIIVDLAKAEALLPRREQSPKEEYRQGDRIRAYILDVKKSGKGPQIILSRVHSGLVKKLFELEVPEIYEGIVEIKSVCREAGERTKIAVFSNDEKVDCVGACVGMRGTRVKEIVRELHGEKIDIVRWNRDIKEYLTAALSPAKVIDVKIQEDEQRAEVIVDDDQLSLAIGKRGQNVRLAAKLTEWNIDIRSKPSLVAPKEEVSIITLPSVGPKTGEALKKAGLETVESIANSTLADLMKIKGIGKKSAQKIIEAAKKVVSG